MANRLKGKVAVVTGAASGIGKATAIEFLQEGAKVVAVDINMERLAELEEEVADLGLSENLKTAKCNITNDADCEAAVKLAVDTFGDYNVLDHNAGVIDDFTLVEDLENDKWDKVLDINLTGTMKLVRASLQYFLPNEIEASIVLVSSYAAFQGACGGPAYSASKAGVNALMKSVAFEYGRRDIRCNAICPGGVLTNITESNAENNEKGVEVHMKSGYLADAWKWTGGVIAMPEDISPLAVYLASDESTFVNGAAYVIDGGTMLSH